MQINALFSREKSFCLLGRLSNQTLRVMRITAFIILGLSLHVSARVSSQTITYSATNVRLQEVFIVIEKQTGLLILYNPQLIEDAPRISVKANNQEVSVFLKGIFKGSALTYSIENKNIVVKPAVTPGLSQELGEKDLKFFALTPPPIKISGTIIGPNKQSLVGATIRVKGKNTSTTTNDAGYFELNAEAGSTLIISYVGFKEREFKVRNENFLQIEMIPLIAMEGEITVVNTGYQKLPKERATGSFSTVSNRQLELRPTINILDRIEGFAGGVAFHRNSVDKTPRIVIRGRSTIYSNDQPLYVVDGFPIEGDINNINPNDVENITILKDAAASSIWGVRAANGVVVIVTKKGSFNQKPVIKLRSHLMVGKKPDLFYLPFMSTADYVDLEKSWFEDGRYQEYFNQPLHRRKPLSPVIQTLFDVQNGVISEQEGSAALDKLRAIDVRNEYSDEFYRNSIQQQNVLNIQGGSEWVRYFFSAGYDKELSAEKGNGLDRITLRSDNTIKLLPKLDLNIGVNMAWTKNQANGLGLFGMQGESPGSISSVLTTQYAFLPYQQLKDEQGNALTAPRDYPGSYNDYLQSLGMLDWNYRPADELRYRNNTGLGQDTRITIGLEYRLLKKLTADLKYQYEGGYLENRDMHDVKSYYARNVINSFTQFLPDSSGIINHAPVGDVLITNNGKRSSHTFRGQLNYTNGWQEDRHSIAVIGGIELRDILNQTTINSYYGYNDRTLLFIDIDKSASYPQFGQMFSLPFQFGGGVLDELRYIQNRYASFYSNASYTFLSRYTLSASGRMDKSSLFGVRPKDRNVPLWSAGASWDIHKEIFFKSQSLSRLRLRTTYGFNGNVSPMQTAYPVAYTSMDPMTNLPTANISTPANPLLQWEKVSQVNLGVDFGLFGNKLSGSVEWFFKNGQDLLGDHFLDPSSGFATIRANVASMRGKGFDIQLNYRSGQVVIWDSRLIFSHATDKVTRVATASTNNIFGGTQNYMSADRDILPILNRPVYSIYSYRWAGLDNAGNPRLYDEKGTIGSYATILNGMPPDQLVYNGPAQPTFFGGWNNNVSWKGFNLSATVTYKFGHKFRRSSVNYYALNSNGIFRSIGHIDYANRWKAPGDELITNVPAYVSYNNFDYNRDEAYRYADILVSDASHIRLKDITFSYDLPSSFVQRGILKAVQLYIYLDNVGILWRANKYGIDPDFVPLGYSNYLPMPLTCTAGIKIEL